MSSCDGLISLSIRFVYVAVYARIVFLPKTACLLPFELIFLFPNLHPISLAPFDSTLKINAEPSYFLLLPPLPRWSQPPSLLSWISVIVLLVPLFLIISFQHSIHSNL